jgi:hypothetical protein
VNPRFFRSLLIASDSAVRAGSWLKRLNPFTRDRGKQSRDHSLPNRNERFRRASLPPRRLLTFIHLPISIRLVTQFEQAVLWIVPLAAVRACHVPAPACTTAIVVRRDGKSGSATARNQVHYKTPYARVLLAGSRVLLSSWLHSRHEIQSKTSSRHRPIPQLPRGGHQNQ